MLYFDGDFIILSLDYQSHKGWIGRKQTQCFAEHWDPFDWRLLYCASVDHLEKTLALLFEEGGIQKIFHLKCKIMVFILFDISD